MFPTYPNDYVLKMNKDILEKDTYPGKMTPLGTNTVYKGKYLL
jgi:hypothetical protein